MAEIVLGIGTSHTPMLSLPPELWPTYAERDRNNKELAYPPNGWVLPYKEGEASRPPEIRDKPRDPETFRAQSAACQAALGTLADTLQGAEPDITIIISDDQDEWFFDSLMPTLTVYWGETVPLIPRAVDTGSEVGELIRKGYGDVRQDHPVASQFGRFLIEYLIDHNFDPAHMTYADEQYGGKVARRYPTPDGELNDVRTTPKRAQGLPHGFSFVVARLLANQPRPILPVFQNTCYPPTQPTPSRSFAIGEAIAGAVGAWPEPARVAVVASGGLSHFVVDEETDRTLLHALEQRDSATLRSLPRNRLFSAASESLNWVALGGAMQQTSLQMELLAYVPVYRTPAGTGGGWAFARWV
jgi:3-O-methylgallate 3,4-dioxygenase